MTTTLLPFSSLCLLLGVGCVGATPSPPPTGEGSLEIRYAEALCASAGPCASTYFSVKSFRAFGYTPAQCAAASVPEFSGSVRRYAEGVRLGKMRLDEAAFARCLARVAVTCHDESELDGNGFSLPFERLCRSAFVGVVPLGGACVMNDECANGARCVRRGADDCAKVCETPVVAEACTYDDDCRPPGDPRAWSLCRNRRCVTATTAPAVGEGAPCSFQTPVGDTVSLVPCAEGLVCDQTRTCRRVVAADERCARGDTCAAGTVCFESPGDGAGVGRCGTRPGVSTAGAPCSYGAFQCAPHLRLACVSGRCVDTGPGASCSAASPARCLGGAYCARATQTCVARGPAGSPCTSASECLSGRCDAGACAAQSCDRL